MNHEIITSFSEVELKPNCLLVIDIDETILQYEGWIDTLEKYIEISNSYDEAYDMNENDWKEYIRQKLPTYTDKEGFFNLIEKSNNLNLETFIVTARDLSIEQLTYDHLDYLNIPKIKVYFSAKNNKAHIIEAEMSNHIDEYDGAIFIDDNDVNLNNVKTHFGDKVKCYKFVIPNVKTTQIE